jgi:hypothetical protein
VTDCLVMNHDWGSLLRAALEALQHMGQHYVVASHPKAAQTELLKSNSNGVEWVKKPSTSSQTGKLGSVFYSSRIVSSWRWVL